MALRNTLDETIQSGADRTVSIDTSALASDAGPRELPSGYGRYEILAELGRGGMGVVYRAYDQGIRREVALKVMAPETDAAVAVERFVQEAQITGQLEHPGIPPVHDLGRTPDGRAYFAMKVVRGESLARTLDALRARRGRAGDFPWARRIDVLLKVGDAVAFAHAHGVIHRDIKPDNVMVGEYGEVQLMDWGLARIARNLGDGASLQDVRSDRADDTGVGSQDGAIAGTPAYMAPEQAAGLVGSLGERTDVFALGALLYEMLCLAPPYREASLEMTLERAAQADWTPIDRQLQRSGYVLPRPPPELVAIAARAMAKDPSNRYPTAAALTSDVRAFVARLPVSVYRDRASERMAKWVQRHPRASLVGGCALVVSVLIALLGSTRDRAALAVAEAANRTAEAQRARDKAQALGRLAREWFALESQTAIEDYRVRWAATGGWDDARFFAELGPERIARYLAAYDQLFRVHAVTGDAPTHSDHFERAVLRRANGDLAGALADLDRALELQPHDVPALVNRGALRSDRGERALALADLDRAVEADPHYLLALVNRAILRASHDVESALADCERALAAAPNSTHARYTRAVIRKASGDVAGAVADYDRILELDPGHAKARNNRGIVRFQGGDHAGAIADFDVAIASDPRHKGAWSNRGLARQALGDTVGALSDFDQAIALDPAHLASRLNRARLHLASRRYALALPDLDRVVDATPADVEARFQRATARSGAGDSARAIADYEHIIERFPHHWAAAFNLARLLALEGDRDRALSLLRGARDDCPDRASGEEIARLLAELESPH